jgi:hypothetical protein
MFEWLVIGMIFVLLSHLLEEEVRFLFRRGFHLLILDRLLKAIV